MKIFVSILLLLSSIQTVNAQKEEIAKSRSSFGFSAGYGLPLGSQSIDQSYTSTLLTATTGYSGSKGVYGSYGSGVYLNAFYTHMFTPALGFDLGINYLIGKKYSAADNIPGSGSNYSDNRNSSSRGLFFAPSILLQATESKFKPYVKAGLIVGTIKLSTNEEEAITPTTPATGTASQTQTRTEFTGGIPFGFKGGFGVEFPLKNNMSFFTEIVFISMSYFPEQGELKQYDKDGVDQLAAMNTSQKKIAFKREITYSATGVDPDQPRPQLQQSVPMGSVSFNAGIRVFFKK